MSQKRSKAVLTFFSALFLSLLGLTARAIPTQVSAWGANSVGQLGDGSTIDKHYAVALPNLSEIAQVSAGWEHSVALAKDGTVWSWGDNEFGQLGDGTQMRRNSPVQVKQLSGVVQVCSGDRFSLALKADGTVWGWGQNGFSQLGNGNNNDSLIPVQVINLKEVVQISVGADGGFGPVALALKLDGTIWIWGSGHSKTEQVKGIEHIIQIVAGIQFYLALSSDGTVWGWGENHDGELGDIGFSGSQTPIQIKGISGVSQVAAGFGHVLALKPDGTVWSWGRNWEGELGNGTQSNQITTPAQIPNLSGVKQVSTRGRHSLALLTDGTVWAWGNNDGGQVGDGSYATPPYYWNQYQTTPKQVIGLAGVSQISAGMEYSLALGSVTSLAKSTALTAFPKTFPAGGTTVLEAKLLLKGTSTPINGVNLDFSVAGVPVGSAYTNETGFARLPVALPNPAGTYSYKVDFAGDVAHIKGSATSTLTLTPFVATKGTVWAWGKNFLWQLGDGSATDASLITRVYKLTGVTQLGGAAGASVALKSDGTVWRWGTVGLKWQELIPVRISGINGVVQVAQGWEHTLALKPDGTVWAWGNNAYGQLGDGAGGHPDDYQPSPVQVSGLTGVVQVSTGWLHSLALKSDGTVWAWGSNGAGELGDGTNVNKVTPVQITSLSGVVQIAGSNSYSLFLKADGTVWATGTGGQLGDGTTRSKSTPVQTKLLTNVVGISAGAWHSLALKSDGTVWAWGNNYRGELGDGTNTTALVPVAVSGLSGVAQVAAGSETSFALKSDGTVWSWGYNKEGQLGNGTLKDSNVPVPVSLLTGQSYIASGWYHALSVKSQTLSTAIAPKSAKVAFGKTAPLQATLNLKGLSFPLTNQNVQFTLDGGVVGNSYTDASGVARLSVNGLVPGVHPYVATFKSLGMYSPTSSSTTLIVTAQTQVKTVSVSGATGSSVTLTATLTNRANGVGIGKKSIDFFVESVKVGSGTTDSSGVASYSYKITQSKGKYVLKAVCNADAVYGSSFSTATLTVK